MKKILSLSLILLLIGVALTGCFTSNSPETTDINILLNRLETAVLSHDIDQTMSCFANNITEVDWNGIQNSYTNNGYRSVSELTTNSYSAFQFANRNIDVINSTNAKVSCTLKSTYYNHLLPNLDMNRKFTLVQMYGAWKITVVYNNL